MLRAEAAAEGGRACADAARLVKDPEARKRGDAEARELYHTAAHAYAQAADTAARPAEGAEHLWLAAARYLDAREPALAAALLERYLPLNKKPERAGEGWYLLAETRRQLGSEAAALDAYRECIKVTTPFAYRRRYQLALIAMRNGELDEAEAALEQNLKLLRFDPDSEAQEKSLFALGGLLFQRRNYSMVARRLGEALGRFPVNPDATRAHYQLAESYYILANQENQNYLQGQYKDAVAKEHSRSEYRRLLHKAADEFLELAQVLDRPEAAGHLARDEVVQVPFKAAECRFELGQYEDALHIYEQIVERYPEGVEHLNALGGTVRCLSSLGRGDKMRDRLADIRTALPKVEDDVRAKWEEWLLIAAKPLSNP